MSKPKFHKLEVQKSNFINFWLIPGSGFLSRIKRRHHHRPHHPTMNSSLQNTENRIGRLLFKQTVELSIVIHILASELDIDLESVDVLCAKCIRDVKKQMERSLSKRLFYTKKELTKPIIQRRMLLNFQKWQKRNPIKHYFPPIKLKNPA